MNARKIKLNEVYRCDWTTYAGSMRKVRPVTMPDGGTLIVESADNRVPVQGYRDREQMMVTPSTLSPWTDEDQAQFEADIALANRVRAFLQRLVSKGATPDEIGAITGRDDITTMTHDQLLTILRYGEISMPLTVLERLL